MSTTDFPLEFPLIRLKPLPNEHDHWVAIEIEGLNLQGDGTDTETLNAVQRLFVDFGMAEAIPNIAFRLPASLLEALDRSTLPENLPLEALEQHSAPAAPVSTGSSQASAILLKLLGQLTSDAETRDIEATLKRDPQLSVQLLRLVNSVAFAPTTKIHSFAQAINLLGRRQLQRWLQLLLFANKREPGRGNPLFASAALRAALLENIVKGQGGNKETQDEAFMIGMFSLLEPLFGQPLTVIIAPLKLADDVNAALLQHAGPPGQVLAIIEAAETGSIEHLGQALAKAGISTELWCKAQIAALRWTLQVIQET